MSSFWLVSLESCFDDFFLLGEGERLALELLLLLLLPELLREDRDEEPEEEDRDEPLLELLLRPRLQYIINNT